MTTKDIAQKLALLPEGLAERNLQSWNRAVKFFETPIMDAVIAEHFPYALEFQKIVLAFSTSEQAKLFRAGEPHYETLNILASDEQKQKWGEPFLKMYIDKGFLTIQYVINEPYPHLAKEKSKISIKIMGSAGGEVMALSVDNIMTALQPMLNLLWDETRGKKNV